MNCTLAYSPCPNDTFIFYALAHRKINTDPFDLQVQHCDIATLNQLAKQGQADIVKISFVTYPLIQQDYTLLPVGAALGKGYGPLVLTHGKTPQQRQKWQRVALPGPYTTAHLLFKLWYPDFQEPIFLPFDEIISQLASGTLDAGVAIHESRFTYDAHGLSLHLDLGKWWWETMELPLPLGAICAKNTLPSSLHDQLSELILESLEYAETHPEEVMDYIKSHAQESDEASLKDHISLYVNEYTKDLGEIGQHAIQHLLKQVKQVGWI